MRCLVFMCSLNLQSLLLLQYIVRTFFCQALLSLTRSALKNVSSNKKCGSSFGLLRYYQTKPVYFSNNTMWGQKHSWYVVVILTRWHMTIVIP